MDTNLVAQAQTTEQKMRVNVAQEQRTLKEQHRRRPNSRTSAKPRQDKLAYQRLDLKE